MDAEALDSGRRGSSARVVVSFVASLLGLGVATYLTVAHYSPQALVCVTNATFNCEKVTTSAQSVVFGVPVAVLGLAFFVPMTALVTPMAWRSANPLVAPLRLALATTGIGFIFYLLYVELFVVHAICLWCSSVHLLTFVVFVCVVTGWHEALAPRTDAAP